MKRLPHRLLSLLLGALLFAGAALSGCVIAPGTDASSASEQAAESSSSIPEEEPTPVPYSLALFETDDTEDLYDLSDYLDPYVLATVLRPEQYDVMPPLSDDRPDASKAPSIRCAAVGAYSETEILLVLEDHHKEYQCVLLDTLTGSFSLYLERWPRTFSSQLSLEDNTLELLSTSPLVLLDTEEAVIYRPESKGKIPVTCPIDEDFQDASITVAGDNIYLSRWNGFVYSLDLDGSPSLAWTLPEDYMECYMEDSGRDDLLAFRSTLLTDRDQAVYLEVSPDTWESETFLFTAEETQMPTVSSDNRFCELSTGEEPAVLLRDTDSDTQKELPLPDSVTKYHKPSGKLRLALPNVPVRGDTLVLTRTNADNYCDSLFFWKTGDAPDAPWVREEYSPYAPVTADYGGVSARAAEISATYDVSIHIGENVPVDYSSYTTTAVTDAWSIATALDTIETALAMYPPGYFTQLADGVFRELRFELVGPMTPISESQNIQGPSAVTFEEGGLVQIAFDIEMGVDVGTVCHELQHVLDYRLERLELLDEEAWNAMNPEGFSYYDSYVDSEGNAHQYDEDLTWTSTSDAYWSGDYDSVYFYDNYAKTFPTEDRARIVEMLSSTDFIDPCFRGSHMREKAQYLFDLIRASFDTTDWPEKTAWELALESA